MIKLYETDRVTVSNKDEALRIASICTGFNACDFKYEVIQEPKKLGLFKKELGIYHCWYEYDGMNADKEIEIADATLYFDIAKKKMLVNRIGYKLYEIDYSDLLDYEINIKSKNRVTTISHKNQALKGALLFGTVGAIVGAANSETVSETVELAELIVRLKFKEKESFEILTCNRQYDVTSSQWRDILDQSIVVDEWFKELVSKL